MSIWRSPQQREAVIAAARARGMVADSPKEGKLAKPDGLSAAGGPKGGRDAAAGGLSKPRGRKAMNKTEAAFAAILEARRHRGEIERWDREGLTLRWPDGMAYTADFAVVTEIGGTGRRENEGAAVRITLIEVKGPFLREDALVKFRAARANWPLLKFEMWSLRKGKWEQLL